MARCDQSIYCLSYKSTEELPFMTLERYANFEEKLTFGLKKHLRNLENFHHQLGKKRIYLETQLKGEFTGLF